MIDPHAAVLKWLASDGVLYGLVGGQIAAKHRYGADQYQPWVIETPALAVYLDGGSPDIYTPVQRIRVECRAYGDTQEKAAVVWRRLMDLSRAFERARVHTPDGDALISSWLQDSGPSFLWDDEIHMDICLCFFAATVGETAAT